MVKHKHHIIPRHMGGSDDPSNLVELTIEEHALAHKKLYEEHGRWQDKIAWKFLSGQISNAEARIEATREYMRNRVVKPETCKKISDNLKEKGHPMQGKTFSEDSRLKMSLSHKGQVPANKGKRCTPEQIERNRQNQLNLPKVPCQFCGKEIRNPGNMGQHIRSKHPKELSTNEKGSFL